MTTSVFSQKEIDAWPPKGEPLNGRHVLSLHLAALSRCGGDRERARKCLEAYLAGYAGMMPYKEKRS